MVAAGLKASAGDLNSNSDGSNLGALVRLARNAEIYNESFDQDIALRRAIDETHNGLVLVQIKYSKNRASIGPAEMKSDIFPSLVRAYQAAQAKGENCTALCLVTNRPISDSLEGNLDAAEKEFLKKQNFLKFPDYGLEIWQNYVSGFGEQYGLSAGEIETGLTSLLGRILVATQQSVGDYQLTKDDLLKYLVGSEHAFPLTRKSALGNSQLELSDFGPVVSGEPVRRKMLDDAGAELENRALIVFEGHGGLGKTASLAWWAQTIADDNNPTLPIVSIIGAEQVSDDWIPQMVTRLNPSLTPPSDEAALHRFGVANPANKVNLIHLSLDGIDDRIDGQAASEAVKKVVHRFLKADKEARTKATRPQCRLVVTCRSFETFCSQSLHLSRTATGTGNYKDRALCLRFGFFSDVELRELIEKNCRRWLPHIFPSPTVLGSDLKQGSIAFSGSIGFNQSALEGGLDLQVFEMASAAVASPLKKKYAELLSDPIMWWAFQCLSETRQGEWLGGDDDVELEMAGHYVSRFIKKAHDRLFLAPPVLNQTLREIAAQSTDSSQYLTRGNWERWACASDLLNSFEAGALYDEAESGGLILRNTELKWTWRYSFIAKYLVQGGAS